MVITSPWPTPEDLCHIQRTAENMECTTFDLVLKAQFYPVEMEKVKKGVELMGTRWDSLQALGMFAYLKGRTLILVH